MYHNAHKRMRKAGKENGWLFAHKLLRTMLDYLVCVYIIFVLTALPLYCPDGYSYIATRKNNLFSRGSAAVAKALVLVLLLYGIVFLVRHCQKHKGVPFGESVKNWLGKIRKSVSIVDFFALWYGAALVLSFLCTDYKEEALMGAGGWNMGFYTQMVMVCSYLLISRVWKPRKAFFAMMLSVSAAVFLLGYLNRFSIYPIEMKSANYSFISTIGNINWYCGYVTTVFFGGIALLWQNKSRVGEQSSRCEEGPDCLRERRRQVMLAAYGVLGFATLVTQGSSSGILTLGVMLLALFCLSAGEGDRMLGFGKVLLLLSAACVFTGLLRAMAPELLNYQDDIVDFLTTGGFPIAMTLVSCFFLGWIRRLVKKGTYRGKSFQILACTIVTSMSCLAVLLAALLTLNTLRPGAIGRLSEYGVFTFSDAWGSNRGATWKCGWKVFAEQDVWHKLTGVGPDAMAAYIYNHGSEELITTVWNNFGNSRLTNAHNEWLTVLVNVGVLGLAGYSGMMTAAIGTLLKRGKHSPYVCACGLCLLAYTVNNTFSFQQVMNVPTMFVLLGMGIAFDREEGEKAGMDNGRVCLGGPKMPHAKRAAAE